MASELNAAVAFRTKVTLAEFCAAAGGSLDAGIGQHPYHDDLFDAALLELESATGIDGVTTRKPRFAGYQGKRLCV